MHNYIMATFEDYLFTKNTKWFLWGGLLLVLGALIFHAGVVVGSHRHPPREPAAGGDFEARLLDALRAEGTILASIREKREIAKDTEEKLRDFIVDFSKKFA